jgi:hypothetical protein
VTPEERADRVYDLYRRGSDLLEHGDFSAAAIPLEQARAMEPEKSSIREALGRAYFRTVATRRLRSSSKRSSIATRSTTSPTSASAAHSRRAGASAKRASTSRSQHRCARNEPTTGSTATASRPRSGPRAEIRALARR